ERGRADAPLFLVNHWVDTGAPSPSTAADANATKVLDQRVKSCEKQRKRKPNIIAVDFYAKGDLMREVNHLNGVDRPPTVLAAAAARCGAPSTSVASSAGARADVDPRLPRPGPSRMAGHDRRRRARRADRRRPADGQRPGLPGAGAPAGLGRRHRS